MRRWISIFCVLVCFSLAAKPKNSNAQVFIDLKANAGTWIPFFPDYRAASIVNQGVATVVQRDLFTSEQTGLGSLYGLNGHVHVPGDSRWMIDFDIDFAHVNQIDSRQTFSDPGPTQTIWLPAMNGGSFLNSANGEDVNFLLHSEAIHYREYGGIRRQINSPIAGWQNLNVGVGISHMAIEQEHFFQADFVQTGRFGQYIENLDSTYLGGEIRTSVVRIGEVRNWYIDFGFGMFWMNGDYDGTSRLFNPGAVLFDTAMASESIDALAVSIDLAIRTELEILGRGVRPGIEFKYISDIASINHPQTEIFIEPDPVSLTTKAGYSLGFNVEVDLY